MTRKLTFAPEDKLYFRLIYQAFLSRGSAPQEKRITKEDTRSEAKILRALKSISDPIGDAPPPDDLDGRARGLKTEGGSLTLEQPEFSRLQGYVDTAQWVSGTTDIVSEMQDWIDAADKVEAETK